MSDFSVLKWLVIAAIALAFIPAARAAMHRLKTDPAAAAAPARPDDSGPLAELLEPIRARHKIPGLAAAIVHKGEVVAIGATGVRRAGGEERLTIHDKFHIGSCTKAMTATMLAMLVEDGVLKWDTTVGEAFDDLDMDEGWKDVTLEDLLRHRGGAPADLNADGLWPRLWSFEGSPTEARMELVRSVIARPPGPRGAYTYSNGGYAIAGAMAEKRTGKAWETLMQERLFAPLGMTGCGFGAPGSAETIDQPRGHHAGGRPQDPGPGSDNPPAIGPGGAVHCTLSDWARFVALHTRSTSSQPVSPLLTPETLTKLHTPAEGKGPSYAMGWLTGTRAWAKGQEGDGGEAGEGRILNHAGSNTMWFAVAWLAPERDLAIVITSNQGGKAAERACDEAAGALIGHFDKAHAGER